MLNFLRSKGWRKFHINKVSLGYFIVMFSLSEAGCGGDIRMLRHT
jgi:hypothetical protein